MSKGNTMQLSNLDSLFSTQAERDNGRINDIQDIDISLIDNFPDHPFKVRDNEEMDRLVDSIKENGVLYPALVRPKENGRYEMIAGHRRKHASELAGKTTLRCMICNYDDYTATIVMVDSNIQRENILPSERAKAYKMKYDALKHQGKRTDLTCDQVGHKSKGKKTIEQMAEENNDSVSQIKRYIHLNNLLPELLEMVDDGKIGINPAYEISFLDEESQKDLLETIECEQCTPSHAQTREMKKLFNEGTLTPDIISLMMQQEKPNQKEKLSISAEKIRRYIPKGVPYDKTEDFICKAVKYYAKHLQQTKGVKKSEQAR